MVYGRDKSFGKGSCFTKRWQDYIRVGSLQRLPGPGVSGQQIDPWWPLPAGQGQDFGGTLWAGISLIERETLLIYKHLPKWGVCDPPHFSQMEKCGGSQTRDLGGCLCEAAESIRNVRLFLKIHEGTKCNAFRA